jgi:hypothetical protein
MSEEPFYAPGRKAKTRTPQPGELLYEFQRKADHKTFRCELRDRGGFGVEAQIFEGGHLLLAQLFRGGNARTLAIEWAESERKAIETRA